jgi:hypothetical protein
MINVKTKLVFNDVHGPFEDPIKLELVLLAGDFLYSQKKLDEIILNGDILDFYNINSHGPKHPEIQNTLEAEIEWGIDFLSKLRKRFPDVKITFIFGNHEDRLERFIIDKCPAFYNMFQLHKMLRLEELNIDWLPYNNTYQVEKTNLYIQHSPPSYGVNGARTSLLKKHDRSYIWGCTHRVQKAKITGASGNEYEAWFNGWLGSTTLTNEHKRVFSYAKGHEEWQHAFIILDVVNDNYFQVNQYGFLGDSICIAGKVISV